MDWTELLRLLWGSVIYRPYVYAFFACFLFFSLRQLRGRDTFIFLLVAYVIAYSSEFSSTRNGVPFGMYVYLDQTRDRELWLSNIPFWDSLSFVFLSYFSWLVAAGMRSPFRPSGALQDTATAFLGGFLMMLLDMVIDPVALRGDRWFLGKIYYYPEGGPYFGVTLSNFLGWWCVGTAILLVFQALCRLPVIRTDHWKPLTRLESWAALGVYAGVLLFNLSITAWIQQWDLFLASLALSSVTLFVCIASYRRSWRKTSLFKAAEPAWPTS